MRDTLLLGFPAPKSELHSKKKTVPVAGIGETIASSRPRPPRQRPLSLDQRSLLRDTPKEEISCCHAGGGTCVASRRNDDPLPRPLCDCRPCLGCPACTSLLGLCRR